MRNSDDPLDLDGTQPRITPRKLSGELSVRQRRESTEMAFCTKSRAQSGSLAWPKVRAFYALCYAVPVL